jgi:hypothetical protein
MSFLPCDLSQISAAISQADSDSWVSLVTRIWVLIVLAVALGAGLVLLALWLLVTNQHRARRLASVEAATPIREQGRPPTGQNHPSRARGRDPW